REAGLDVGGHAFERLLAFDAAVGAGDLPHAVQDAADGEIGRECKPLERGHRPQRGRRNTRIPAGLPALVMVLWNMSRSCWKVRRPAWHPCQPRNRILLQ